MGWRFRKSIKIAPGIKLNLNKNSVSLTTGTKGVHYTVNSKGKRTVSTSIPGTGLYYTKSLSNNASSSNDTGNNQTSADGNSPKKGSCLLTLGALAIIPLTFFFGWVIGIIWLLFFRKRMNHKPKQQKLLTIGVIIYCIISFMLTMSILCSTPSSVESLEISSNVSKDILDVGKDYKITVSNTPEDSSLEYLEYHIQGNSATFDESDSENIGILHTRSEGEVTIYVSSGNVESNSITFKIVDSTKDESDSTTSSNAASLSDEAEKTESTTNIDSNSTTDTEPAISNDTTVNNASSDDTTVQSNTESTDNSTSSEMVWIDSTGKKYHRKPSCSNMSDPYQVTIDDAIASGRDACKKCY